VVSRLNLRLTNPWPPATGRVRTECRSYHCARVNFDAQILAGGGGETRLEGTATLTFGLVSRQWVRGAP